METPAVSVCMITYNHENFIEEAIHGVILQKTNFPFELVICDDASGDNTLKNIKKIKETNPNCTIKITGHDKNKGMIPNFIYALKKCQGKYIALCEGDDYWTDPLKLQKQVDFLDANPEYVLTCHNAKIINEKGKVIQERKLPELHQDQDYSAFDLKVGAYLLSLSLVFRNVIKKYPKEFYTVLNGDTFLISLLGNYGKGRYLEAVNPAVYREHQGGVWSGYDTLKRLEKRISFFDVLKKFYHKDKYLQVYFEKKLKRDSNKLIDELVKSPSFQNFFLFHKLYSKYHGIFTSRQNLKKYWELSKCFLFN
tara:strand:+ start:53389 stop:54315 length:927 start_codon:yes stop_codon:yes gene_type:complete